jgi:hypothetical protein
LVSVTFPTLPRDSLRPKNPRSTVFKLHSARVCRNRGRLPSSRSIESAPERLAPLLPFLLMRASDTALGLIGSYKLIHLSFWLAPRAKTVNNSAGIEYQYLYVALRLRDYQAQLVMEAIEKIVLAFIGIPCRKRSFI